MKDSAVDISSNAAGGVFAEYGQDDGDEADSKA
jgi:hypothetical protein